MTFALFGHGGVTAVLFVHHDICVAEHSVAVASSAPPGDNGDPC